ncbi:MAG: hypothetical protein L3J43_01270 [Sulfurovum sp.]|nr:hypothetical protein [Sulfurovum sp.]
MISWVYKLFKSKTFLLIAAIAGFSIFTMNKEAFNDNLIIDERTHSKNIIEDKTDNSKQDTFRFNAGKKSSIIENNSTDIEIDEILYAKAMMKADEDFSRRVAENGMPYVMDRVASNDNIYRSIGVSEDRRVNYHNKSTSYTRARVSAKDDRNHNDKVMRTTSGYKDENIIDKQDDIDLEKENIEPNEKLSDSTTVYPGYMTGSAITASDSNASNNSGVLNHNNNYVVFDNSQSVFPSDSKEAQHNCYFDNNTQMKCEKSIKTCIVHGEEGLKCTISYYLKGLWYMDPTHLTIDDNKTWIKTHLHVTKTFVMAKFSNKYYEERYASTSLILPDFNSTKSLKLIQYKKYIADKTVLDRGMAILLENNHTSVNTSILLRGTRFGIGHQKVKGGSTEFLEALKVFLSTFTYVDDSDIYDSVDYWTIMDADHAMGDREDFALTAMEWLLLNGVDPKYITLTELKTTRPDTPDITLILETQEPSEKWIIRDTDVINVDEIYPDGYESLIMNEYRYED